MTKVEAIKFGTAWLGIQEKLEGCEMYEFFKMSVKALQEEPCDIDTIEALKPVTPKQEPKTGHWIETAEEYYKAINEEGGGVNENTPYFTDDIACSECLAKFSVIDNETERFICCPNCGAKMESEE